MKKLKNINSLYIFLILLPIWGIMALQLVVRVKAIKDDYTLYYCIFAFLMLLLIGISVFIAHRSAPSARKRGKGTRKGLHLNPIIAICFATMCVLMLYSDLVIFKKYYLISLMLLVLFGGLYIVWQKFDSETRDTVMSVLMLGIEIGFIGASVFCFLFRPTTDGIRYSGLSANPNVYGIFLITVWCVLLTRLDYYISRSTNITKVILLSIEFGMAGLFLYMTGARTAFLTIGFISLIWFIMRMVFSVKDGKPFLKYIVITILIFAVSFIISFFLLMKLPGIIGHPVEFERDRPFAAIENETNVVYASDATQPDNAAAAPVDPAEEPSTLNRLISVLKEGNIDLLLNGRLEIYNSYIKRINFSGHRLFGKKVKGEYVVNAHNNTIQMAYSYGQFSAIPYALLCILALIYAIRYYVAFHDRSKIAAFPLMIIVSFLVSSLTELIFIPFQSLLAFCFYICLGELMITYGKKRAKK